VCYRNVLEYTGGDNTYGRKRYREYVEEGLIRDVESPFKDMKGQVVIGGSGFIDWLYKKVLKNAKPDKAEQSKSRELIKEITQEVIRDTVCNVFEIESAELLKRRSAFREARMVYIDLCCKHRLYHKSLGEIGHELGGLTVGGMSQARKRLKEKIRKDDSLMFLYNQCDKMLSGE